ncbi:MULTISPECIES: RNase adapter RapZ [unclassified Shewanella]|uniref:RNase adapter RapZ n=1 Tax=unclassified Shewanella TaxID=196818 RepID=UPI000C81ACD6|nr:MULTISPECIES: RNase adapter RapZ [unclassified Shewanella]MDO6619381.1 RNase adapter RapZ [Shewanella sp. 6_MG-2023]MDO6641379.1 RNase adapter RapZ [Shewanella sp. 5_MG-2023]MDO6776704.1 RNase adapter RapZ [Shewanella sp. 3_MG-2023]PMG30622.1 RNase adaptor protein RapZ [Shewanella sp. 10N.286.52.C2]PMG41636.1 RNase adaptor protein RapZ [Shewanella sp. 10N.286.52.B9]
MKLVIVSGRSGSGKSVALRVLEDLGYYCVDNLPLPLIGSLLEQLKDSNELVAISVDVRNIEEQGKVLKEQIALLSDDTSITSFFLNANDKVLLKRFSETRRLHPLSKNQISLQEAIKLEGRLLEPIAKMVDHYIDTSQTNIYELSDHVRQILLGSVDKELVVHFESFGFKHGMPAEADFMFDVRFLPNPHWELELRPYTGLDAPVQEFLERQPLVNKFIWQIENLFDTWMPHLERNNRSYLTIAIGCTGGQHRSVYIADQLAKRFNNSKHKVSARHRELGIE